jgi:hypothetical protein
VEAPYGSQRSNYYVLITHALLVQGHGSRETREQA